MGIFDWFRVEEKKKRKMSSLTAGDRMVMKFEKAEEKRLEKLRLLNNLKNGFTECPICNKSINSYTRYFCNYCKKGYCEEHRLPENHKCKNPKLPSYMKRSGQKYERDINDRAFASKEGIER